jgi:hypothetical protein
MCSGTRDWQPNRVAQFPSIERRETLKHESQIWPATKLVRVSLEQTVRLPRGTCTKASRVRGDERNLELDPTDGGLRRLTILLRYPRGPRTKRGQATKGTRWMPRHQEAMKDVETCEKLRGAGLERRSVDIRMGKPGGRHGPSTHAEYIGMSGQRGELKHLSTRRKENQQRLRK